MQVAGQREILGIATEFVAIALYSTDQGKDTSLVFQELFLIVKVNHKFCRRYSGTAKGLSVLILALVTPNAVNLHAVKLCFLMTLSNLQTHPSAQN